MIHFSSMAGVALVVSNAIITDDVSNYLLAPGLCNCTVVFIQKI